MAKKRVARSPVKRRGKLYQLQHDPKGVGIWEVVEQRGQIFTSKRLKKRPTFGPSDALLDLSGKTVRQYQADGSPGGRFGRFKEVPFGLDPSSGFVDIEQAAGYAATEVREHRARLARAQGDPDFADRVRIFWIPDAANQARRRFPVGNWKKFIEADRYRKPEDILSPGRWVLAEVGPNGELGRVLIDPLFRDEL